jgi:hypothetical protein
LAANTPASVLDDMLLGEEDFRDEAPQCSVPVKERLEFQSQFPLPWPSLKFIIQTARTTSPGNYSDLRRTILDMSGLERLRQELQTRYFAKSKVIKTFSVLSKARESGRIADVRLRNHKNNLTRILQTAAASQSALAERIQRGDSELRPAQEYIQTSLQTIERDLESASETLRLLGRAVLVVEDAHQEMDADLKYLEQLQNNGVGFTPDIANLLTTLFGGYGATLPDRLSFFHRNGKDTVCLGDIDAAIENLKRVQVRGKRELSEIAAHGVNRLETIANWMEDKNLAEIQLNNAH